MHCAKHSVLFLMTHLLRYDSRRVRLLVAQPPADVCGRVAGGGEARHLQVLSLDGRQLAHQLHLLRLDWGTKGRESVGPNYWEVYFANTINYNVVFLRQ